MIKKFIKENWLRILSIIFSFLALFLFFMLLSNKNYSPPTPPDSVEFKLNLSSDTSRLECSLEQRRCYRKNLGYSEEKAIENCKEIDYCDETYRNRR